MSCKSQPRKDRVLYIREMTLSLQLMYNYEWNFLPSATVVGERLKVMFLQVPVCPQGG